MKKAIAIVLTEDDTVILKKVISSYEEYHNLRDEYAAYRVGLEPYINDNAEPPLAQRPEKAA